MSSTMHCGRTPHHVTPALTAEKVHPRPRYYPVADTTPAGKFATHSSLPLLRHYRTPPSLFVCNGL